MKIGFVVNHPTQFEVPFYQHIADHYPEHTFKVFYLKNDKNGHYDEELGKQIKWGINLYDGYPHVFLGQASLNEFEQYLYVDKFDLIIINGYKNQYSGYADLCKKSGVIVALKLDTVLFNQPLWKIWMRKLFLKKEYNKFNYFMATGKVSKDYLLEMGINPNRIAIFSYCTDNEFFGKQDLEKTQSLNRNLRLENKKVILSVAKFMKRESPWDILKAFTSIKRNDLSLVLVGDGEEKDALIKYSNQFPELDIHFPGYVDYLNLPSYYQVSNIFIHAAKDEPWGVSVQEAIAGECFVICSDKVGSAQDLILENKNGLTYKYGDYKELAAKIENALSIDNKIVDNANKKILSEWNYDVMFTNIRNIIK